MKPTYKQQFDKLTEAYIHNKVNPFLTCACFVGNLLNRDTAWTGIRTLEHILSPEITTVVIEPGVISNRIDFQRFIAAGEAIDKQGEGLYSYEEIALLENNFLSVYNSKRVKGSKSKLIGQIQFNAIVYNTEEDALFAAFESSLDLLKSIHIQKGEIIDESPKFVKRTHQTSCYVPA